MAVLVTPGTIAETNDTGNVTTYASGSFTPVANRLYLLGVSHSDTAPEATVPTIATTTGLNFVQVGSSIVYDVIANNVHRLTLFRAMKPSGLSNGTYTVTLGDAGTGAASVLVEYAQVVTTGTDGADAVRNISTNNADAGANPSITMGAFNSNNNGVAAFFAFDSQTAATAPDTGWTVSGDASYNTPATGITALWRGANSATASCTHGSADWAGIAVELVGEDVPLLQVPQPPPPPKAKAAVRAAILAGACFFAPLPIPDAVATPGPSGPSAEAARLATVVVQYPGIAGPVYVPAPAAEPETIGSAQPSTSHALGRATLTQYTSLSGPIVVPAAVQTPDLVRTVYPDRVQGKPPTPRPFGSVGPVFVPDVTQPVTALAWRTTYPDRVLGARRPVAERATVQPIDTPAAVGETIGSAQPAVSGAAVRTTLTQYTALVGPVVVPAAAPAAPDLVSAVYPSVVGRRVPRATPQNQPEFGFVVEVVAEAWEPTFPDATPRPTRRAVERSAVIQPLYVPDVTAPVAALSWKGHQPDRTLRAKSAADRATTIVPLGVVDAPVVVPLSWQGVQPERTRRAPRVAEGSRLEAPLYVADVTVIAPALSWKGTQPDRIPAKPDLHASRQAAFAFDRFQAPGAVVVPDLSWQRYQPDVVVRAKRLTDAPEPVAPLYVPDVTAPVTPLSWTPVYPERIVRLAVHPSRVPFAVADRFDPPVNIPAPDLSWQRFQPDFVIRAKRLTDAPQPVAPLHVPDVTAPVTALSWKGTQADRVDRAVRLRAAQQAAFAFDRFAAPGTVQTPDLVAAVYPDVVVRRVVRPLGSAVGPLTISPALEQWLPVAPVYIWAKTTPRQPGLLVQPIYLADVTVLVPVGAWRPIYPVWIDTRVSHTHMDPGLQTTWLDPAPVAHVIADTVFSAPRRTALRAPDRLYLHGPYRRVF